MSLILFILSSIFCVGPPPPSPKPKRNALWFTRPLSLLFFTVFSTWRDFWAAAIPWHPAPAPYKKAGSVFRVQSPVLLLFPSPKCLNQARPRLGVGHPNSLCPTKLPRHCPLPGASHLAPRVALPFSCRSGNVTHLFQSPMHPIGITRGEMGQDLGPVNAFPEKGVMLEGRERKICAQGHFRASSGFKLGLHFLSSNVQEGSVQGEDRNRECHKGRGWICCLLDPHTSHSFPSGSRRNI